ncbi:DUF680 domain-containing protein [Mesorhizobium sp. PAMC28654]|uniref:DUF680 domain-containing protein n=1 Tax=Mesorhizobium sp. PAMC28654 TaxID=2880934 RepID=UPI001D0A2C94|nr:DUF680 domain-containing protein [Mesorhizobium sp. PAMC28654]UDL86837.1 DUF680 domain-containing protein [Mesorhizobium sp. PAMC28654]
MKKIILTAATLLAISGTAFAGSDHYGSNGPDQQAIVNVDKTPTASIANSDSPVYKLLNSSHDTAKPAPQGADRNLFGNN